MNRSAVAGLTLVEVVAAVALLSALTVAILPLLVDASKAAAPRAARIDPADLRTFSDHVLADDAALARLEPGVETGVGWDEEGKLRTVAITRLAGTDGKALPHDWIRFQCGDTCVLRFLPRGVPIATPQAEASQ